MRSGSKSSRELAVLALALLAGFAAVYLTFGQSDNSALPPKVSSSATGASNTVKDHANQMAAFVAKKVPEALPPIVFKDGTGKDVTLADFKGRTVLLNLWATWCNPCREEMPSLDRLQQAMGSDKFEVVALSLDKQGPQAAQKFLDDVKAKSLKLYIDVTAKQGIALKLVGMPTTILINKDGLEIGRLAGPAAWDSDDAKDLIRKAMQ